MGLAENKFHDYLRKNISDLEDLDLIELLMYLPCLTTATQERLRQQVSLSGNQNTLWNFLNDLRKRTNWVQEFIQALRKCSHEALAQRYADVYSGFLLPTSPQQPRVPQPFSQAANHQPPVAPASYDNRQQPQLSPNTPSVQPEPNRLPPSYSEVLKSGVQASTPARVPPGSLPRTQPGLHDHPSNPDTEWGCSGRPASPTDVLESTITDDAKLPVPETSSAAGTSQKYISNSLNEVSEKLPQDSNDHKTRVDNILASEQPSPNLMTYYDSSTLTTWSSTSLATNSTSHAQQPDIKEANDPIAPIGLSPLSMPPAHTLITGLESSLTQPTPRESTPATYPPSPTQIPLSKPTYITPYQSQTSSQSPPNQTTHVNHKPVLSSTQTTHPNQKQTGTQPPTTQIIHPDPKQTGTQPPMAQIIHPDPKQTGTHPPTAQIIHPDPKQTGTQPPTAQIIHPDPKQTGTHPPTAQIIHPDPKQTGTQPPTAQITHSDPKQTGTHPPTTQIIHPDPKQTGTQPPTTQIIHPDPKQTGTQPLATQKPHLDTSQASTAQNLHRDHIQATVQPEHPLPAYGGNSVNARGSNVSRAGPERSHGAASSSVRPLQGSESEDENVFSKPGILRSTVDNMRLEADETGNLYSEIDPLQISECTVASENRPLNNSHLNENTRELSAPRGPACKGEPQLEKSPEETEFVFNNSPGESNRHRMKYGRTPGPNGSSEGGASQQPEESSFDDAESITVRIHEEPSVDLESKNDLLRHRYSDGQHIREDATQNKEQNSTKEHTENNYTSNLLLAGLLAAVISTTLIVLWKKRNSI